MKIDSVGSTYSHIHTIAHTYTHTHTHTSSQSMKPNQRNLRKQMFSQLVKAFSFQQGEMVE